MKSSAEIRKSMTMGVVGKNKLRQLSDFTVEHRMPENREEAVIDFADIMDAVTAAREGVVALPSATQQDNGNDALT